MPRHTRLVPPGVPLQMIQRGNHVSRIVATFGLAALLLSSSPTLAAGYLIKQGKGYAICEAIKKELDKLGPLKEPLRCPQRVAKSIPGLTEPAWDDLDVEKHWDLFVRLNAHDLRPGAGITEKHFENLMTKARNDAKHGAVKLQVLRANVVRADDEPENIVRILRHDVCEKMFAEARIHLVTADLTEIDEAKRRKTFGFVGGDLMTYGGHLIAVYWGYGGALTVASDRGSGLVPFCTIDFDWSKRNKELGK